MNALIRAQKRIEDPQFVAAYQEWLRLPMSQEMISLAKSLVRPPKLSNAHAETALYNCGCNDTIEAFLGVLTDFDGMVREYVNLATVDARLGKSTYGVDEGDSHGNRRR